MAETEFQTDLLAAEQGDADAQYKLGDAYYYGTGVKLDYEQAITWYWQAANQGHAEAQYNLALAYYEGEGLVQDYAQAVVWSKKAATQGHVDAQYDLGNAYTSGEGVAPDDTEAIYWWEQAAKQGHSNAQYELGVYYKDKEDTQATYWWEKAANQGHDDAQYELGIAYYEGKGVEQSYVKAVDWWDKAATQEHTKAQYNLGLAYYKGEGVTKDIEEKTIVDLWEKAASKKYCEAQYRLGNIYYEGINNVVELDREKAIEFWQKAAEQGHITAQYNLGIAYKNSLGVTEDCEKALQWLRKVAEHDKENDPLVISAQYRLGIMYKDGLGCSQNLQEAEYWFSKAYAGENSNENDSSRGEILEEIVLNEKDIQKGLIDTIRKSAHEALLDIEKIRKIEEQEKAKQELEKANSELENMMGLIAHKFRGSIQVLYYNALHENNPNIALESLDTMRGLFDIFGIISTNSENLCEKLLQDREGNGTILATLEKSLLLALADLLIEDNRNKILQHYIAYAKRNNRADINVTPRQWARKKEYLGLWKKLQIQWQETFMMSSNKFEWVKAHLFPLELNIVDDNVIHFERYGITESILLIVMTEMILNAIKYYSVQENTTLKINWKIQPDFCIFSSDNPYESKRSDKGSHKGQIFLKTITQKLGGHFSTLVSQNHYIAELQIPTHLLIEEKI